MGLWDYIILALIIALAGAAVFVLIRSHKAGKNACGCEKGCAGCPGCAMKEEKEKPKAP